MRMTSLVKYIVLFWACILFPKGVQADLFDGMSFKSSEQYQKVLVQRVISADTLELETGEKVRLIGIKAPEAPKRRQQDITRDKFGFTIEEKNPLTPIEEQAFDFVRELLEDKFVRLEFDSQKAGDDYVTLAYVFRVEDSLFVNTEILKQGFAALRIRIPNTKYKEELRAAYRESRREKRGLQGDY